MTSRAAALLFALALAGCKASFDIAPAQVPRLSSGTVRGLDGDIEQVPDTWQATVIDRRRTTGYHLMLPESGETDVAVIATVVHERDVDAAEASGLTDRELRFGPPGTSGIAPLGGGLAASRGLKGKPAPPAGSPRVLWILDDDYRLVELPLAHIERIHVKQKKLGPGAKAGIIAGSVVGGALVVFVAVVGMSAMSDAAKIR